MVFKLALLGALGMGTAFYAGGRVTYSGIQAQLFPGAGLKVCPDPSNVWSYHETVTIPGRSTSFLSPIVIDFDNNQRMDTEIRTARVVITDVQLVPEGSGGVRWPVRLRDNKGVRWILWGSGANFPASTTFRTPLVLPIGSDLKLEWNNPDTNAARVTVNMIGRLVTM